jgi:hypothetical protein
MIQSVAGYSVASGYSFVDGRAGVGAVGRTAGESQPVRNADGGSAEQDKALTPAEMQIVEQLKEADRKVRAHEQAHLAVGADLVRGGPTYSYQTGPDSKRYAVGGEVSIDASPGATPEETIPKARHIRATALAPADPSPQDHSVAAQASRMEGEARVALAVERRAATGADDEAGAAEQGGASLYRVVGQEGAGGRAVGRALDTFA